MKTPKRAAAPADRVALYEQLVATNPDIELKGATHPYTSLNGNMFSYLHPSGSMALRLPADERDKFLKRFKTTLFEAYGVIQKEYVTVPEALLKNTKELEKYFHLSWQSPLGRRVGHASFHRDIKSLLRSGGSGRKTAFLETRMKPLSRPLAECRF